MAKLPVHLGDEWKATFARRGGRAMKRRPRSAASKAVNGPYSASSALPVATQNLLAATRAIVVPPHVDIDIASVRSAPAIGIDVDPGMPFGPVATPSIDIDVDIGASLTTTHSFIT